MPATKWTQRTAMSSSTGTVCPPPRVDPDARRNDRRVRCARPARGEGPLRLRVLEHEVVSREAGDDELARRLREEIAALAPEGREHLDLVPAGSDDDAVRPGHVGVRTADRARAVQEIDGVRAR